MLTELRAVNRMLALIGEAPVTDVTAPIPEVIDAREILSQVTLEVLALGWGFNTDEDYPLSLEEDSRIRVPDNALSVDASDTGKNIIQRAGLLYDKDAHSYVFTEPVKADVTWSYPFHLLPYAAQNYIMIRAARRFQRDRLGSVTIEQLSEDDERMALGLLYEYDSSTSDYNVLENNTQIRQATTRR